MNFPIYTCIECGRKYEQDVLLTRCPYCGGLLQIVYKEYKLTLRDIPSLWRYMDLLPISRREKIVSLLEGFTPLLRAERLGKIINVRNIYLKDETRNPTGSFTDRGTSLEISKLLSYGVRKVICATRGDTGASLAAYAARANVEAVIYVPKNIEMGKLYQMAMYGAKIILTNNFIEASSLADSHKLETYVFKPSSPFYLEGVKTIGFEILEQLRWAEPDFIIVPMGNGGLASMILKAVRELKYAGLIENEPRIVGMQIKGQDSLIKASKGIIKKLESVKEFRKVIAGDLLIEDTDLANYALKLIKRGEIKGYSVDKKSVIEAVKNLAKTEGIFSEPASAVAIAGIGYLYNLGEIDNKDTVIAVITGAGLKVPRTIIQMLEHRKDIGELIRAVATRKKVARIGATKIKILQLLKEKPYYGYDLRKKLQEHGVNISLPTLYQHLEELEKLGLVTRSERVMGKRKRVYYIITEKGLYLISAQ